MPSPQRALLAAFLGTVFLVGCANPVPPSGGPQDTTAPQVIRTSPEHDTVNVSTDTERLRIDFSEYVERSSLPRALSVTPTFERQLEFNWSGRSVEIEFPSPLRDETTYIFTLDTNLSDVHGVSLESPITVAFSTGPRINRGQIEGQVVSGRRGQGQQGVDVYAYAIDSAAAAPPWPLPDRPSYRTQTGEAGGFAFDYMREQRYYVVALRDNNRNRAPDALEPFAVPPRLALRADSGAGEVPVPWLLTRTDTIPPALQDVQSLSRERLRVTFDEPIRLETRAPAAWAPRDSTTEDRVDVQAVYTDADRPSAVMVRTAPMADRRHMLTLARGVVTDTSGSVFPGDTARFQAAAREDTTEVRFRGFLPADLPQDSTGARPLLPGVQPGFRFNQPVDSSTIHSGVRVQDTTGQPRSFTASTENGLAYRLELDPALEPGEHVDVSVEGAAFARPDTTYRRRVRRVTRRALGELAGRVVVADTSRSDGGGREQPATVRVAVPGGEGTPTDTVAVDVSEEGTAGSERDRLDSLFYGGPVEVEMNTAQSPLPVTPRQLTTSPGSAFEFEALPEGQFRFRAYLDRNANGQWDGGQIQPYVPAEPAAWLQEPVEVRPRWTTELPMPLRIPVLSPLPSEPDPPVPDTSGGTEEANQ